MSQQYIYILLGAAFVVFMIVTIRDWALQRRNYRLKTEEEKNRSVGGASAGGDVALPLQLQAYERLVVFMERIKPEHLISRVNEPGLRVRDLRMLMIHSLQAEYEHNLSQQIYVSPDAWQAVSNAKEQVVSLINAVTEKLSPGLEGTALAKALLEVTFQERDFPVTTALGILNAEAKKLMRR